MMESNNKRTIVAWGGYQFFQENIDKLKNMINISYLYAEKRYVKNSHGYLLIENSEEIVKLSNPYVIICLAKIEDVSVAAEFCIKNKIPYTHMEFLLNKKVSSKYIKAFGGHYVDDAGNSFIISPKASDTIYIDALGATKSYVRIGKVKVKEKINIKLLGHEGEVKIGDDTTVMSANIGVNSLGKVEIGKDCMLSHTISLMQSDQHLIFDLYTKERLNYPKNIIIGNHVWVGREVMLLGGANIGDNSICGARAVTSSKFPSNVIIAGCPAKIVRENIIWARDLIEKCDYTFYEQCFDKKALQYLKVNKNEKTFSGLGIDRNDSLEKVVIKLYENGITTMEIAKLIEKMYGHHFKSNSDAN